MRFHWQNLNEKPYNKPNGSGFFHGRAWWSFPQRKPLNGERHPREYTFCFCWKILSKSFSIGFNLGQDSESQIAWHFCIPPIALYWHIDMPWKHPLLSRFPKDAHECQFAIHNWCLWFHIWTPVMSWNSKDPWYKKTICFDIKDRFLGKNVYKKEVDKTQSINIPLDNALYPGTATFEKCTWKRPLWFTHTRYYTTVDMNVGLPHSGKGTASYNCGDDGLYGWSVNGWNIEKAIAKGIENTLESRKKYGKASKIPTQEEINEQAEEYVERNKMALENRILKSQEASLINNA